MFVKASDTSSPTSFIKLQHNAILNKNHDSKYALSGIMPNYLKFLSVSASVSYILNSTKYNL